MRRKPSMFSRNYRRQLRNRRIKLIGGIVLTVLVLTIIVFSRSISTAFHNFRTSLSSISQKSNDEKMEINKDDLNKPIDENVNNNVNEVDLKEESFDVTLNSGLILNLKYTVDGEEKTFNEVEENDKIYCNVSPNKQKIVVLDKSTQEAYIIDTTKSLVDFTKKEYKTTKNEIFKREYVISKINNYIWMNEPTFMSENHIGYISNLPWLNNSGIKYLWVYDISKEEHKGYYKIKGPDLTIGKLTEKGLTINVNNKQIIVDKDGKIVK